MILRDGGSEKRQKGGWVRRETVEGEFVFITERALIIFQEEIIISYLYEMLSLDQKNN